MSTELGMVPNVVVPIKRFLKPLPGGSRPCLMWGEDGKAYVVKFRNNPQGDIILINEFLAAVLASELGLPVPRSVIVEVPKGVVNAIHSDKLCRDSKHPARPGLHMASLHVGLSAQYRYEREISGEDLVRVKNRRAFAGMLAFDKWVCNCDGRQAVFYRFKNDAPFTAAFIDNGYCFGGPDQQFRYWCSMGRYPYPEVYKGITQLRDFEPWLSAIQNFDVGKLIQGAALLPDELKVVSQHICRIAGHLHKRRGEIVRWLQDDLQNKFRSNFRIPTRTLRAECERRIQL
jgi:hypothetical protein